MIWGYNKESSFNRRSVLDGLMSPVFWVMEGGTFIQLKNNNNQCWYKNYTNGSDFVGLKSGLI